MDPKATSPGGHRGLFQLAPMHAARVGGNPDLFYDPEVNVATAYALWSESGWAPWSCRP